VNGERKELMSYAKYFKPGQKILLRAIDPSSAGRTDALTVYFKGEGAGYLDLVLPYRSKGEESYPFSPDSNYEILSDSLGMGVKLIGRFQQQLDSDTIRIEITRDIEVFQRRLFRRIDTTLNLRYTKGRGQIRTFRQQWEKNIQILQSNLDPSKLPPFQPSDVNLSESGIRFNIKSPVEVADLCMLFLQLDVATPPICILSEIVWLGEIVDGRQTAGMQFLNILDSDKKKISAFIKEKLTFQPPKKEEEA